MYSGYDEREAQNVQQDSRSAGGQRSVAKGYGRIFKMLSGMLFSLRDGKKRYSNGRSDQAMQLLQHKRRLSSGAYRYKRTLSAPQAESAPLNSL